MLCAISVVASAQVVEQVEVTKNYAPEVGTVHKMEIEPNMVDTTTLHPEIDYAITPRSYNSSFGLHRFKPATATYWEYNRVYPFYLKLGVGYPLNTVGDLYATTHRADVGYLTGYINHYGEYSKLKYFDGGVAYRDNRSMQMTNKFGVTGGKYIKRYTLSGDLNYQMNTYHRYPLHNYYAEDGTAIFEYKRRKVNYDNINFAVDFGDSFSDYSHLNFKVYASAHLFNDKSELYITNDRYLQMNATAGVALARELTKRSALSLDVDYKGYYGLRSLRSYDNTMASAKLKYFYRSGNLVDMEVGVSLIYDHNPADTKKQNRWHAFPHLALSLNINDKGVFVPYVEVSGELQNNSYYSLVQRNPYVAILGGVDGSLAANSVLPNTELYNVCFGVSGHSANSKFAYRFYANMSFMTNAIYWYNINHIFFGVESAKRNIWSLCGAIDYKPISQLLLTAQVKGSLYTNFSSVSNTLPPVEALLQARYTHKKFTIGLSAELYGTTKWTMVQNAALFYPEDTTPVRVSNFSVPAWVDLSVYADWHINKACTVYAEGNNLIGDVMPRYRWVFYREMGASFTVGVKVQF